MNKDILKTKVVKKHDISKNHGKDANFLTTQYNKIEDNLLN